MTPHEFGGSWTDEKLRRVEKYLTAYTTIFSSNERARHLRTIYIDAFAGTGSRSSNAEDSQTALLFDDIDSDEEALRFKKGSASIALDVEPGFNRYVFIESDAHKVRELSAVVDQIPRKRDQIEIIEGDANRALLRLVRNTDWKIHRAVVFLDPYGMSVEWPTIEALANTKAVDLWLLFPLGQAVNRLLMRKEIPSGGFARALTRCFGTQEWRDVFYQESSQGDLFGGDQGVDKVASFESIAAFFRRRLETVFAAVAPNSLPLLNSRNNPLFLLCFAASNEKGAKTAIKIANDVLRR